MDTPASARYRLLARRVAGRPHTIRVVSKRSIKRKLAKMSSRLTTLRAECIALEEQMRFLADDADDSAWVGTYGEKVMDYMGAHIVEAPAMDVTMLGEIEVENETSLSEALANRSELPRYLRDALHTWELEYSEALAGAPELFIPSEIGSKSVYGSPLDNLAKG